MRVGDPDLEARKADFSSSPPGAEYNLWKDQLIAAGTGLPRDANTPLPEVTFPDPPAVVPWRTVDITISWRSASDTQVRTFRTTTLLD
jgi:hypothetical protein